MSVCLCARQPRGREPPLASVTESLLSLADPVRSMQIDKVVTDRHAVPSVQQDVGQLSEATE